MKINDFYEKLGFHSTVMGAVITYQGWKEGDLVFVVCTIEQHTV